MRVTRILTAPQRQIGKHPYITVWSVAALSMLATDHYRGQTLFPLFLCTMIVSLLWILYKLVTWVESEPSDESAHPLNLYTMDDLAWLAQHNIEWAAAEHARRDNAVKLKAMHGQFKSVIRWIVVSYLSWGLDSEDELSDYIGDDLIDKYVAYIYDDNFQKISAIPTPLSSSEIYDAVQKMFDEQSSLVERIERIGNSVCRQKAKKTLST